MASFHSSYSAIFPSQRALALFLEGVEPESIQCSLIRSGLSNASVAKCSYLEKNYLVKCFDNPLEGIVESSWTKLASDIGVGPILYASDAKGKYLITEFVEGKTLDLSLARTSGFLENFAKLLKKLHTSKAPFEQKIGRAHV